MPRAVVIEAWYQGSRAGESVILPAVLRDFAGVTFFYDATHANDPGEAVPARNEIPTPNCFLFLVEAETGVLTQIDGAAGYIVLSLEKDLELALTALQASAIRTRLAALGLDPTRLTEIVVGMSRREAVKRLIQLCRALARQSAGGKE